MTRKEISELNRGITTSVLSGTVQLVREIIPGVKVRKDAWVYGYGREQWEFQTVPRAGVIEKFYWSGRADDAYEARAKGWTAYLKKFHGEALDAAERALEA